MAAASSHGRDGSNGEDGSNPDLLSPGLVASIDAEGDLRLTDGRLVRIAGVDIPIDPDRRAGILASLVAGRGIVLGSVGRDRDRRGRIVATVERDDGADLGVTLLELGLARLHPRPDLILAPELFEAEASARAAGRGLWSHAATRVHAPFEAWGLLGRYGVVEGKVLDAASVRGRIFLNFGADRTTDFTVTVAAKDAGLFEASGIDPLVLTGRRVRVRGYVDAVRGPSMALDDPRQVEVLEP